MVQLIVGKKGKGKTKQLLFFQLFNGSGYILMLCGSAVFKAGNLQEAVKVHLLHDRRAFQWFS